MCFYSVRISTCGETKTSTGSYVGIEEKMIRVWGFCPVMSVGYSLLQEKKRQRVRDAWERLYTVLFDDRIG